MQITTPLSDLPRQEVLMIITLIMAMISMTLSSLALLPHLRPGAVIVRDAVLWGALVVVFVSLVGLGWRYWLEQYPLQGGAAPPAMPLSDEPDTVAQY